MEKIKKYRTAIFLTIMFVFSLHVNAVFEGRNQQLKDYTEIRQQVEIEAYSSQKATGIGFGDPKKEEGTGYEADTPFHDSSLIVFIFCSLLTGTYYLVVRKKKCTK